MLLRNHPISAGIVAVGIFGTVAGLKGAGLSWLASIAWTVVVAGGTFFVVVTYLLAMRWIARRISRGEVETEELRKARNELDRYRSFLSRVLKDDVELEESQTTTFVLSGSGRDHYIVAAETQNVSGERCRWRRVQVSSNSNGSSEPITARLLAGRAFLLDLDSGPNSWYGAVCFDPPILPQETRRWELDITWPGMADPLRTDGRDVVWFYSEGATLNSANVRIKYTADWTQRYGAAPHGLEAEPREGVVSEETIDGERVLSWKIDSPRTSEEYQAFILRSIADGS